MYRTPPQQAKHDKVELAYTIIMATIASFFAVAVIVVIGLMYAGY